MYIKKFSNITTLYINTVRFLYFMYNILFVLCNYQLNILMYVFPALMGLMMALVE